MIAAAIAAFPRRGKGIRAPRSSLQESWGPGQGNRQGNKHPPLVRFLLLAANPTLRNDSDEALRTVHRTKRVSGVSHLRVYKRKHAGARVTPQSRDISHPSGSRNVSTGYTLHARSLHTRVAREMRAKLSSILAVFALSVRPPEPLIARNATT